MDAREERGILIAAMCKITPKENGMFLVPSQSGGGPYRVHLNPINATASTCTCPDFEKRGEACKHVHAVRYVIQREARPDGSVTVTESITLTQTTTVAPRPTYRQNWRAYNQAQMHEKTKVQELLFALCQGVQEPPPAYKGRPRYLRRDAIFAIVMKVYACFSARRVLSDLEEAEAKGYLTKAPSFSTLLTYLEDPAITPVLRGLIVESSLPLKTIDVDFACDSTGFMVSRFDRWFDHKYGRFVKKHSWIKVHVMTGVKTNVVTAVEILGKDANDCPQLPVLLKTTTKNFAVREVSADKEYLSAENVESIHKAGGTPYIAIKSNTSGAAGGLFRTMYHAFCLNKDQYMQHYHKRSNVESTFSMVKAKFGDHVRAKSDVAMVNEVLCKLLCHNLCCLVSAIYELGIAPQFWAVDEPEPEAKALPAPVEVVGVEAWDWV